MLKAFDKKGITFAHYGNSSVLWRDDLTELFSRQNVEHTAFEYKALYLHFAEDKWGLIYS